MPPESVPEPGVVERVDVDAGTPEPVDCLAPGERPLEVADLSPGWIAATDRELLVYHPDRDPPVGRVLRANVTGLALRRAGGSEYLGVVPKAIVFALGSVALGGVLLAVDPRSFVSLPGDTPTDSFSTVLQTTGWAMNLLGTVLVFTGILAGLVAVVVAAHWLLSSDVTLVAERGGGDPLECPTTRPAGTRAVGAMEAALAGGRAPADDGLDPGGTDDREPRLG